MAGLVGRDRRQKIARIGETVGAERAELRQPQHGAVILADIAARRSVRQFDPETQAARHHDDLAASRFDNAELGDETGASLLRYDQHFAVGIVEAAIRHRAVGGIDVDRHADLDGDVAVAAERDDALDEIGRLLRNRKRRPAQLRRRRLGFVEGGAADHAVADAGVGPVHHRGLDAVSPGAPVFGARGRERGARDLLGVKTERRPLRRVAADRQRAGNRLGDEMIAEAGLVLDRRPLLGELAFRLTDLGVDFCRVFGHAVFSALGFRDWWLRDWGFRGWGHGTSAKAAALAERAGQLVSNATNIRLPRARRKSRKTVQTAVAGRRGAPCTRSAESRSNK